MKHIKKSIFVLSLAILGGVMPLSDQKQEPKASKAWEIGIGANLMNWNRVSITGFQKSCRRIQIQHGHRSPLGRWSALRCS